MRIVAVGKYIPEKRISNYEQAEKFEKSSSFIDKKIGFKSISKAYDETIKDMCMRAYDDLKSKVDIPLDRIGAIQTVIQKPDQFMPNMSAILHNELGITQECMVFDIVHACTGYIYGLKLINSLDVEYALLFTCDKYRQVIDENDENVAMIFGDGATVTLLATDNGRGAIIDEFDFGTLPNSWKCIVGQDYIRMDGSEIFRNAAFNVPKSINRLLEKCKIAIDEVGEIVLHQATKKIVDFLALQLKAEEKIYFWAEEYGNLGQSSIPMVLAEHPEILQKDNVILCGFGAGFTWGTVLLKH